MKVRAGVFLILFSIGCTKVSTNSPNSVPADASVDPTLSLIGGLPASDSYWKSSGRYIQDDGKRCTITRIGKRHFITAGHCMDIPNSLTLFSHSTNQSKAFSIASQKKQYSLDVDDPSLLTVRPNLTYSDWGVFTIKNGSTPAQIGESLEYLDRNFAIRPIGNPDSVRAKHSLMVAGMGFDTLDNDYAIECDLKKKKLKNCSLSPRSNLPDKLRYAFFEVERVGPGLIYTSYKTNEYDIDQAAGRVKFKLELIDPNNPLGIIAKGDSGGPALNSKGEIVGVVSSVGPVVSGSLKRGATVNNFFSKFDAQSVNVVVATPIVDVLPATVSSGSEFKIYGYKIASLDLSYNGTKITPSGCKTLDAGALKESEDYVCFIAPKVQANDVEKFMKISYLGSELGKVQLESIESGCEDGSEVQFIFADRQKMRYRTTPTYGDRRDIYFQDGRVITAIDGEFSFVVKKVTLTFFSDFSGGTNTFAVSGENFRGIFSTYPAGYGYLESWEANQHIFAEFDVTSAYKSWEPKQDADKQHIGTVTSLDPITPDIDMSSDVSYFGCKIAGAGPQAQTGVLGIGVTRICKWVAQPDSNAGAYICPGL